MQRQADLQRARTPLRTEWTSRVVSGSLDVEVDQRSGVKRHVLEDLLNNAFAELRDGGYHVTLVQQYAGGFVIFANRVVATHPADAPLQDECSSAEVTARYTFLVRGKEQSQTFPSLEEAVRVVSAHFKDGDHEPVSIHLSSFLSYNRLDLQRLVALHGK